ncbi:MAG: OFA family MFS transporter [Phycisphaerae bacterium]
MASPVAVSTPPARDTTRWQVLVGAIIVQLVLGTVYGYSIFWTPLQSHVFPPVLTSAEWEARGGGAPAADGLTPGGEIVVADEPAAQRLRAVQQGNLKYAFAICILSFALVMVVAGRVQDLLGPRIPALIGAALMGTGFLLAGLMSHPIVFFIAHAAFAGLVAILLLMLLHAIFRRGLLDDAELRSYASQGVVAAVIVAAVLLGQQYVGRSGAIDRLLLLWGTIGFLAGAGIGFAYVCPIAALIKWFPAHKGLVSGLAVAGFGFGAYVFKDRTIGALGYIESRGVQPFFLVHAAICFVAITLGALLLRNPPGTPAAATAPGQSAWQETLRRPAFYVLWLMFFSGALAGLMVIGIVAVFAGEQLVGAQGATGEAAAALMKKGANAVGVLAIFNAIGRIAWGFVSDRIGRTNALAAMFALQSVTLLTLASLTTELSLTLAAAAIGFNFGGNFALFPSLTADLFGARNLGANYGWVFTSYGIAGVVGITAGNSAKVLTGSYLAAFLLAAGLCAISTVLAVGLRWAQKRNAAPVA